MAPESESSPSSHLPDESLIIHCPACRKSVTAPVSMLGQLVECPFCQDQFVVDRTIANSPTPRDPSVVQGELASLESQLRENVTQITELRGHVSRLNMELHRHQLRMKTLSDRQTELQTSIASAQGELSAER